MLFTQGAIIITMQVTEITKCCAITAAYGIQVAQLSQRDRAAGWVSYGQKWKTVNGENILRTL